MDETSDIKNQINKLEGWNTYIKDEIIEELRSEEIIQ